jgi:hypothetical protein
MEHYSLKLNTKGGPDWNGAVWNVYDERASGEFVGYVEKRNHPIRAYNAFARHGDEIVGVGHYETKNAAAEAVSRRWF